VAPFANPNGVPIFASPDPDAIYPEYVTDLEVAHCPSDTDADAPGAYVAGRLPDGTIEQHIEAVLLSGDPVSRRYFYAAALGRSYWYHGYAMSNEEEFYGVWNATGLGSTLGPVSPVGAAPVTMPVAIKDWSGDLDLTAKLAWTAIIGKGYGGGSKVLRLREGIERFSVTDINNPAASALAQSELVVMFDTYGSFADSASAAGGVIFNHIPGGCNILYMDGHVNFIRYPQQFPIVDDAANGYGIPRQIGHYGLG
jgi:prepilin-type processing-associated H-X9-DG protein